MSEQSYDPWQAYYRSKLANLLFMRELGRRAKVAGVDLVSAAAHPGWARTNLQYVGPRTTGRRGGVALARAANAVLGQSATTGALPQLRAATDPGVRSGDYFGPRGLGEQRGLPRRVRDEPRRPRRPGRPLAVGGVGAAHRRARTCGCSRRSAAPGQAST